MCRARYIMVYFKNSSEFYVVVLYSVVKETNVEIQFSANDLHHIRHARLTFITSDTLD